MQCTVCYNPTWYSYFSLGVIVTYVIPSFQIYFRIPQNEEYLYLSRASVLQSAGRIVHTFDYHLQQWLANKLATKNGVNGINTHVIKPMEDGFKRIWKVLQTIKNKQNIHGHSFKSTKVPNTFFTVSILCL